MNSDDENFILVSLLEMCHVSVDESVNNGNNSNGNDVRHIISS